MCYAVMLIEADLSVLSDRYIGLELYNAIDKATRQISLFPYFFVSGFEHPRLPVFSKDGLQFMDWGLIPSYEKQFVHNPEINRLNARNETAASLSSYRTAFKNRQFGILQVNGFYESKDYRGFKIPYLIYDQWNEYLNLAVIYDTWTNKETGETRKTFAILTTDAIGIMKDIHNSKLRMPVILPDIYINNWLDKTISETTAKHLAGYQYRSLEAHTVSKLANFTRENRNRNEVPLYYQYTEADFNLERISKQARKREKRGH